MSLPPGFLDELRTRTSLAQVVGRKVIWDQRKSNQAKGDLWAPCPFHQEKTASFHVDDRKGFYYCFGCHAKGDAIGFVKDTENVGFMEAVEILAREAGMQMPARDPKAQEKADRRTQLAQVMEQAVNYFRLQLKTNQGSGARDYLDRRGLAEAAQDRWGIGYAPDSRRGLITHLREKGVEEELIVASGLAIKPDDGGAAYDRFRGRIIFPIRDARGRAISLGGRALDPNARAKYLNGPETELFDKGRSLFNHGPSREAAGKGQPLVVAEGYMDVIALSEAGFGASVAPLGTAITEDQLRLLWRIAPEPIIALDGDKAGLRAAMRVIDLALPMLEAGQSLRFAIMPEGQDPDDLIKARGAAAMQALLEESLPMVKLLWQREIDGRSQKDFDSPERKAMLDKALRQAISKIPDQNVKKYYGEAIRQFRWEFFRPNNWAPTFKNRIKKGDAREATKRSLIAANQSARVGEMLREMAVLGIALKCPDVLPQFEADLETFELLEPGHQSIMFAILENYHGRSDDDLIMRVAEIVGADAIENILGRTHVQILPAIRHRDRPELAIGTLAEQLAFLDTERGLRKEIEAAETELEGVADEGLTWRVGEAGRAHRLAERGQEDSSGLFDRADNGVLVAREEKEALDALLKQIEGQQGGTK